MDSPTDWVAVSRQGVVSRGWLAWRDAMGSDELAAKGVTLITGHRKNMKPKVHSLFDRAMLSKRFIIETINDQLKNISQIEHSRHRSMHGFMLNLLGGLIAYCHKDNKPALNLTSEEQAVIMLA